MKRLIYAAILCLTSSLFVSCGDSVHAKVDPKAFESKEEVQRIYDAIVKCMGAQAAKTDEVVFYINNPADKGKTGDAYLYIMVDMQDSQNPKQLLRQMFHGELGYWMPLQQVTVDVHGSNKEDFRLDDELFNFTENVPFDKLFKVLQDAYAQGDKDSGKFTYRYISHVKIDQNGYRIDVKGKLEANDQVLSNYYTFDFSGKLVK